ncbi:hypothetical protein [Oceanobacillus sp. FSL H7-0719]
MIKCLECDFTFKKWKEVKSLDGGTVPVCPKCETNGYKYKWEKLNEKQL